MKLDELSVERDAFDTLMEENGGELTEEAAARFDFLNLTEADKLDRYVFVIRSLECDAAGFDGKRAYYQGLADAEARQRDARNKSVAWLKRRVKTYMEGRGVTEIRGEHFGFSIQKNGGKPAVELLCSPEALPREWTRITVEPDREVIRNYLAANGGEIQPYARLAEPTVKVKIV